MMISICRLIRLMMPPRFLTRGHFFRYADAADIADTPLFRHYFAAIDDAAAFIAA